MRNQKEVTIIQFYDHLALTQTDIDFKDFTANTHLMGNVERASQRNDIAIIKTSKPNPSVCNVSDLSPALLEDVVTVGHPKNLFYTVSKGSINAYRDKNQNFMANKDSMRVYSIHIDAPVYPGSSGGPLYFKGKVIGVNYGGYEDTTLNFSIHHNILKKISELNSFNLHQIPLDDFYLLLQITYITKRGHMSIFNFIKSLIDLFQLTSLRYLKPRFAL